MNDIFHYFGILGFLRKIYEPPNLFVFQEQDKFSLEGMKYTFPKIELSHDGICSSHMCYWCPRCYWKYLKDAERDVFLAGARKILARNYRQNFYVDNLGFHGVKKKQIWNEMHQLSMEDSRLLQRCSMDVLLGKIDIIEKHIGIGIDGKSS